MEDSYFGCKIRNRSDLEFLYNTLCELELLDPYNYNYDHFHQIFITSTSTMLVNLQPLKVVCDNYKAAFIFRKIEPLFLRLSYRRIGKSGVILNRNSRPFRENHLAKAISIFLKKAEVDDTLKKDIDTVLDTAIDKLIKR